MNTRGSQGPFLSNLGSRQGVVKRCFKAPPELSAEVIPMCSAADEIQFPP